MFVCRLMLLNLIGLTNELKSKLLSSQGRQTVMTLMLSFGSGGQEIKIDFLDLDLNQGPPVC